MEHYKVGMYGGSFNPLHNGHIKCIRQALCCCDELHIIIGDIPNMDDVDIDKKFEWFRQVFTAEKDRVVLHSLFNSRKSKSEYTLENWVADSLIIKEMIGKPIDVVFCGSDYEKRPDNPYLICYPSQDIVYFERDDDKISSSEYRKNINLHKDWVPEIVQRSYSELSKKEA